MKKALIIGGLVAVVIAAITASTFLSTYQIPLLVGSIGLLLWAYYSINNKLTKSCDIQRS